jgi:hypothetical protein
MAAPVTYQRFALYFEHPWAYAGETIHRWSLKFNLSGAQALLQTEMEPTALDLAAPVLRLSRTSGHFVGWRYYPPEGHTATGIKDYLANEHPCTRSAYAPAAGSEQQLEVCALAEASVGKSATGKPVFLRKWIHGVLASGEGNEFEAPNNPPSGGVLHEWINGAGPKLVVPVDPTGGTQGTGWTITTHLHTHQLRRGPKRKKAATQVFVPVPIP